MPDSLPEGQAGSKVHHPLFLLNERKMDFLGARLIVLLVGCLHVADPDLIFRIPYHPLSLPVMMPEYKVITSIAGHGPKTNTK